MRVALLDVGSTSAHVDVVELPRLSAPEAADAPDAPGATVTVKHRVSLCREVGPDGRISADSVARLAEAVRRAAATAADHGADELLAYATAVVRDAPNRDEVLDAVAAASGVRLGVMTARQEARLTYEGARAWLAREQARARDRARPRPGRPRADRHRTYQGGLLVLDIGGGTLDLAYGDGARAERAASAPLGSRRLALEWLPDDPATPRQVARLRKHLRRVLADLLDDLGPVPADAGVVGASRVLTQLAALTGGSTGDRAVLRRDDLRSRLPDLARTTCAERLRLPGVSRSRAPHILAGALAAEAWLTAADRATLPVSPWGLREGIALRLAAAQHHPHRHPLRRLRTPA